MAFLLSGWGGLSTLIPEVEYENHERSSPERDKKRDYMPREIATLAIPSAVVERRRFFEARPNQQLMGANRDRNIDLH